MNNNQQVILNYQSLSELSSEMRQAADEGDWDKLIELEHQYRIQADNLALADELELPDEISRQEKINLIRKILEDESEIRRHTENRMNELQNVIQSNRQEQLLNQTYVAK